MYRIFYLKISFEHQTLKMFSIHGVPLLYSLLVISLAVCGNHALEDYISNDDNDHIQRNDDILQPPGKFTSKFKQFI